jgi:hypothetical protein
VIQASSSSRSETAGRQRTQLKMVAVSAILDYVMSGPG